MTTAVGQLCRMTDAAGRDIGTLCVEEVRGDCLIGTFTPGADYPAVEPLFRAFAEIVEDQVLSLLDQVAAPIEALGIRLSDGTPVHDVQIYPDGGASCRLPAPVGRNGTA